MKTVYCIVVTFNGMQWMEKCLGSLSGSDYPVQIIVIDNGSNDGTVSFIKEKFPSIQLVETGKNLGFGQANNIGFNIAIGNAADYAFLLNQDAWIENNTIGRLIEAHINHPRFGIISPLHLNGEGSALDMYFFDYLLKSEVRDFFNAQLLSTTYKDQLILASFVNAAAWLISRDCLIKTGGFDPVFFHYGEDQNYAQRVLYWGFKIGIDPATKIYHDRAQRIRTVATDRDALFKKDWLQLLIHACNIQRRGYAALLMRRCTRYGLQALGNMILLKPAQAAYNLSMSKKIVSSLFRIRKSRSLSSRSASLPYLRIVRAKHMT